MSPSRLFARFLEREPEPPKKKNPKVSPAEILKPPPPAIDIEAAAGGLGSDTLALHIDRQLNTQVWNGTRFDDRMFQASEELTRGLLQQMERSLVSQEAYDDFEARFLKQLGLDSDEPAGALRDLETRILGENRIAWNQASIAAQGDDVDTTLIWSSRLEPPTGKGKGTTAGCAWSHGRSLEELPDPTLPKHWGCQCMAQSIASPDSNDPERAASGALILAAMADERDAFLAAYYPDANGMQESARTPLRPSRLFREADAAAPLSMPPAESTRPQRRSRLFAALQPV